ncbi:tetratricopeptide repeat protein [Pseudomonas sp. NA-150]|uniref:tetratricopeptide repeat protein n=1 Tax=Pseudomonas sp. NA-150 TaxID=3367525 RepID=UPI0037C82930
MQDSLRIVSLLERVLPEYVAPGFVQHSTWLQASPGIGLPSQQGFEGAVNPLVALLEESSGLSVTYWVMRQQALNGDIDTLNDLAWVWLNGKYWRADPALAGRLLRIAALQGSAAACFNLAQQHYFGRGVAVVYARVASFYRRAFDLGLVQAAARLGDLYDEQANAADVEPDWQREPKRAFDWYLQGAHKGDAGCRFEVGYRLLHGVDVPRDLKAGQYWLELAAVTGITAAAEELAVFHRFSGKTLRYLYWRDQAVSLGSERAINMKADDQLQVVQQA